MCVTLSSQSLTTREPEAAAICFSIALSARSTQEPSSTHPIRTRHRGGFSALWGPAGACTAVCWMLLGWLSLSVSQGTLIIDCKNSSLLDDCQKVRCQD